MFNLYLNFKDKFYVILNYVRLLKINNFYLFYEDCIILL